MGKKRNRQPDANADSSEDSTESCEETSAAGKCPHVTKAVNLNKLRKNIRKSGINKECAICKKIDLNSPTPEEEGEEVLSPSLWLCLQCGNIACGQEHRRHAFEHYQTPHSDCHFISVNIYRWNIWCYQCDTEVANDSRLQKTVDFVKKAAVSSQSPPKPKTPVIPCQKDIVDNDVSEEKQKILNNIPKVQGFRNLGNTCYFNAVLQCLVQTPFLRPVLGCMQFPDQKAVTPNETDKENDNGEQPPTAKGKTENLCSFTTTLWETLKDLENPKHPEVPYSPTRLLLAFKDIHVCMDGGQHDSHELLKHLLEIIRSEDFKRYQAHTSKKSDPEKTNCEDEKENKPTKLCNNKSRKQLFGAERVFRGLLVSTLECLDCHHVSQCTEPFLDLSLPVTADKPQPPVWKRKNSGFEDMFDIMGNNISNVPSKHQLKKEKKAARKNRKNKRHENLNANNDLLANQNISIEESNGGAAESEESDADVEDNVEIEDNNLLLSPMDNMESIQHADAVNSNTLNSPTPTDVSMTDLTQTRLSPEAGSPENEHENENERDNENEHDNENDNENENEAQIGLSLSTSLVVNSDLTSPEVPPTVSPLSSTDNDDPSSPISNLMNGDGLEKMGRPVSRMGIAESYMIGHKDDAGTWKAQLRKERVATLPYASNEKLNASFKQGVVEDESAINDKSCNGVGDINSGLSSLKLAASAHQSPSRYATKEGECSIQSCLNHFSALELMSGANKVGCENCTAKENKTKDGAAKMVCTPSTKQYLISKVPPVLILHLKRFQAQSAGFRKVTKHVTFPALLDLAPVCKDHNKPRLYALYGVVEHSGTLHGGHYVAYVKTRQTVAKSRLQFIRNNHKERDDDEDAAPVDANPKPEGDEAAADASSVVEPPVGQWYYISDTQVREVDEATVLQSQAYLLFYERIL